MTTAALNTMRPLYAPAPRLDENRLVGQDGNGVAENGNGLVENGSGLPGQAGVSFLDALGWGQTDANSLPRADELPVEKNLDQPGIFSTPEARDDNVDPQILLTQKLADSLVKGLLNAHIGDKSELPIEIARPT